MQKKNKIMLKAVAILLSLVLITTCIVSSTFAKFVIQKSTKTEITLEAYGVTLGLDVVQTLKDACEEVKVTQNGNSLSVELKGFKIAPGDDFSETINFALSGAATTYLRMNMDVDVEYDIEDFIVDSYIIEEYDFPTGYNYTNVAYLPFDITLHTELTDLYDEDISSSACPNLWFNSPGSIEAQLLNGYHYESHHPVAWDLTDYLTGFVCDDDTENMTCDLSFERLLAPEDEACFVGADDDIMKKFNFGFKWNFENDTTKFNILDTWFMNSGATMNFRYTFTIEQVDKDYQVPGLQYTYTTE